MIGQHSFFRLRLVCPHRSTGILLKTLAVVIDATHGCVGIVSGCFRLAGSILFRIVIINNVLCDDVVYQYLSE